MEAYRTDNCRLFITSPLHLAEFLNISLKALKITQYKSAARIRFVPHKNAPMSQNSKEPKSPITIHIKNESKHPSTPSPIAGNSRPETSKDGFDGGFGKKFLKLPRVSFSFQPLYKPKKINSRKTIARIVVEIRLF